MKTILITLRIILFIIFISWIVIGIGYGLHDSFEKDKGIVHLTNTTDTTEENYIFFLGYIIGLILGIFGLLLLTFIVGIVILVIIVLSSCIFIYWLATGKWKNYDEMIDILDL